VSRYPLSTSSHNRLRARIKFVADADYTMLDTFYILFYSQSQWKEHASLSSHKELQQIQTVKLHEEE